VSQYDIQDVCIFGTQCRDTHAVTVRGTSLGFLSTGAILSVLLRATRVQYAFISTIALLVDMLVLSMSHGERLCQTCLLSPGNAGAPAAPRTSSPPVCSGRVRGDWRRRWPRALLRSHASAVRLVRGAQGRAGAGGVLCYSGASSRLGTHQPQHVGNWQGLYHRCAASLSIPTTGHSTVSEASSYLGASTTPMPHSCHPFLTQSTREGGEGSKRRAHSCVFDHKVRCHWSLPRARPHFPHARFLAPDFVVTTSTGHVVSVRAESFDGWDAAARAGHHLIEAPLGRPKDMVSHPIR